MCVCSPSMPVRKREPERSSWASLDYTVKQKKKKNARETLPQKQAGKPGAVHTPLILLRSLTGQKSVMACRSGGTPLILLGGPDGQKLQSVMACGSSDTPLMLLGGPDGQRLKSVMACRSGAHPSNPVGRPRGSEVAVYCGLATLQARQQKGLSPL